MNTKKIVLTAMFAGLVCVATMVIHIPSPMNGYVNLGDAVVILGAFLMGPVAGALLGGIGSMLADLFLGYGAYIPATLIIKAIMGFTAAVIARKTHSGIGAVVAAALAELIMILGYFVFEAAILGNGFGAVSGVPGNVVQGIFGAVVSVVLYSVLKKNRYISEITNTYRS